MKDRTGTEPMMKACPPFASTEFLDQDLAIRQFCPARVEQGIGVQWGAMSHDHEEIEIEMWPHCIDGGGASHGLDPIFEMDQEIVDTFFNVECYQRDNADKSPSVEEENTGSDRFQVQDFHFPTPHDLKFFDSSSDVNIMGKPVGVDQGLHLVHLLLACAEAVGCRDTRLAGSILDQVWPLVDPWGDSLQRVSHCFAMGLHSRLAFLRTVSLNGSYTNPSHDHDAPMITREDRSEAFSLLHQTTPYITFGFMSANDAIYAATTGKDSLHIVDLGMEHALQWSSLIRAMASKSEGCTFPRRIRITAIVGDSCDSSRLVDLENELVRLSEEALSLGIRLKHRLVAEAVSPSSLARERLEPREGEALVVNSMMHLHKHVKESRGSLKNILLSIKKLNPVLLTVVEQDANHNGPFFLGRFLESLHYYSAIFDSLEAGLSRRSLKRVKIEAFHFAEEIRNIVAYEGCDRVERHERADQWRRQLGRAGFHAVDMKFLSQVRLMVSGYGFDGYTVVSDKGGLQLGWKGRAIMVASAWCLRLSE